MKHSDIQVGMFVLLENGYQGNFKGCIGKVIARRNALHSGGGNILVDFSLDGNEPPFEGHRDYIPPHQQREYEVLPEALGKSRYPSRWWVHPNRLTQTYNNKYLDGGLL